MLLRHARRLLVISLLATSTLAQAQGFFGQYIELASGPDYPPLAGETLPGGGLATELVRRAFALRGIRLQLTWLPWKRAELDTSNGLYQASYPYVRTPQRSKSFVYSSPVYVVYTYVYANKPLEATASAVAGKTICVPQGYALGDEARTLLSATLPTESPLDMEACARMVSIGRADFFLSNNVAGIGAIRRVAGLAPLYRSATPFVGNALYLIVPVKRKDAAFVVRQFNQGLAQLRQSGAYQQIVDDYLRQNAN